MLYNIYNLFWFLSMGAVLAFAGYMLLSRRKYKNRGGAGAFFFENDCLVLNTGLPYAIPLAEIDYVALKYSSWELENKLSYSLTVQAYRRNGKRKTVFYKGYGTAKLAYPADMAAALEAHGVRCEMIDQYS